MGSAPSNTGTAPKRSAATYHSPFTKVERPAARRMNARRLAAAGLESITAATPPPALAYCRATR